MSEELIRLGLVDEEDIVLDEAALTLALLDHPDTDLEPYHDLLADIAVRLDAVGGDAATAEDRAAALASVLAGEFGFIGDQDSYDDPDNADLIRVIDRRRGLPVSLSILHVAAARRVGWRADLLDLPGHVLVLIAGDVAPGDDAPVIVDPFHGGARVGAEQLAALLTAFGNGRASAAPTVGTMPNRAVLIRLLLNQATRAERGGKGRRALHLYRRMTLMAPAYGHAWWEQARLELVDGDVPAARRSLSAMLEITREPELRQRISDTLQSLPAA